MKNNLIFLDIKLDIALKILNIFFSTHMFLQQYQPELQPSELKCRFHVIARARVWCGYVDI